MTRVAVVDDHPAVLAGLERLVLSAPDLEPVAFVEDPADLRPVLARHAVDLVVVDHDLGRVDGLHVCLDLKRRPRPPGVVVYSGYAGPALAVGAAIAGADALVGKAAPVALLLEEIRAVAAGVATGPEVDRDAQHAALARLGSVDVAIAAMLLARTSLSDVAAALGITRQEVANRARRIISGLSVRPLPSAPADEPLAVGAAEHL